MQKMIDVTGDGSGNVFLIRGEANLLYEAGMAYCGDAMVEKVKKALNGERLDAVLISHSHYDHVAGLPFVRKEWPDVKVYASRRAKEILSKPSALATIRELSLSAAKAAGSRFNGDYEDEDLRIDVGLEDGQTVTIGDHRVTALETIGHTKCCLSYLVDQDIMFCSETIGVMTQKKQYIPAFLVDYKEMIESVKRARAMKAKTIVISHYGVIPPEEVEATWDFLLEQAQVCKEKMIGIIESYPTKEEQLIQMERVFHAGIDKKDQPDQAFLINAASMLRTLKRQFMGGEVS